MPASEKARRAAFVEAKRRKAGGKSRMFKWMNLAELEDYAHKPVDKKKKKNLAERK